jgi:hypothetical protein
MNLDQYAYSVTFCHGNVEYPVRVIADTPDGMLIESEDFWAALGEHLPWRGLVTQDEAATRMIAAGMRSRFPGFSGLEIRHTSRPNFNGAHVQIHMRMKGKNKMHRMYLTWANTAVRKLPAMELTTFNDVVRHVGESFPYEFEWDDDEYQGNHKELPITVFARGAQMGICKVHVDIPGKDQKVFRGSAARFVDMIIQAKAYVETNT